MPNAKLETQIPGSSVLGSRSSDTGNRDLGPAVSGQATARDLRSQDFAARGFEAQGFEVRGFEAHELLSGEFASGERPSLGPVSTIPASISGIFHVAGRDADEASGGATTLLAANSLNSVHLDGALFQQALGDALQDILSSESA
jgi:hypothetical protein